MIAVLHLPAVDEDRHVLAQAPLVVERVPARPRVVREVTIQRVAHGGAVDLAGGAGHMPLYVVGEAHRRHGGIIDDPGRRAGSDLNRAVRITLCA